MNEGDPVVALPGKYGGLASVTSRGLSGLRASLACGCGEEAADVEIYLGATSPAFALSGTQYATYPHFVIIAVCHRTAGAV